MTGALLFDLDGTMIESDPLHAAVFVDLFAERGRHMTEADYISGFLGRINQDIFISPGISETNPIK